MAQAYVRFVPEFMKLEKAGFPHGLSLSGNFFETKELAEHFADKIDNFMNAMVQSLRDFEKNHGAYDLSHAHSSED